MAAHTHERVNDESSSLTRLDLNLPLGCCCGAGLGFGLEAPAPKNELRNTLTHTCKHGYIEGLPYFKLDCFLATGFLLSCAIAICKI